MKSILRSNKTSHLYASLGAVTLSLCLLGGLFSPMLGGPSLAQERLMRTLTVTGRGTESIPATIAQVRLGVEVQGKTAEAVQEDAAKRSAAVVALLKSRNVEKLQTTGVRLNPVYSYNNNVQQISGYSASNIVSFEIGPNQAGNLLDQVVKAGATRIDGINLIASDSAISTAQKAALREATADAQQQADAVLSALNLTRRDIVNIQVNGASTPPPTPLPIADFRQAMSAEKVQTPIVAGEQQVEAAVTLQISY